MLHPIPKSWPGNEHVYADLAHLRDNGMWRDGIVPVWAQEMMDSWRANVSGVERAAYQILAESAYEGIK